MAELNPDYDRRLTAAEQCDLRAAFERDKWAGEWNSLPTAIERLLRREAEHHLDMHRAYRPEVVAEVAVHLGEHESWDHIAEWCGGRIDTSQDPSGEYTSMLVLPNGEAGGDWAWVVLNHAGEFHIRAEVAAPEPSTTPGSTCTLCGHRGPVGHECPAVTTPVSTTEATT